MQQEMDADRVALHIPAVAAAVILADGRSWAGASGNRILRGRVKATLETVFAAGSVTKTFIAALILRLAEQGVLSLDDPVGRWLPRYRTEPRLTIRRLLHELPPSR